MVSIFLMIVSLLFNSHSADAAPHVQKGITYDGCNQPNPWGMNPSLDKNGHLAVDTKNLSVRSNIKSEDKEVIKTSSPFYAITGTQTHTYYMDYELNRKDGIPQSLKMTSYALETPTVIAKKTRTYQPPRTENKTIFGYKDGNCYVAQMTLKVDDKPEQITYDRALCDKILRIAKAGMKKMEQCKAGFEQIKSAIKEYNDSVQKSGGQLSEIFTGVLQDNNSSSNPYKAWSSLNTDFNSIMAVSSCHGVRSAYTYDHFDPDTVIDLPDASPFATNIPANISNMGEAYAPTQETKPAK